MNEKTEVVFVQESKLWAPICSAAQNGVVQVFAQSGKFDWCKPYRIESQYESFGSGFLIDDEGYIVTNAHVVENAKYVWIQLSALGRQRIKVDVVGICPDVDIALLKINDEGMAIVQEELGSVPFLLLGDSDKIQTTDGVLVMGYPLGQYHVKSTIGIVSGRETVILNSLLQVTAPINPGNSGGPVMDIQGQVIGIAVAIAAGAQNIGYAIPVNVLKILLDELRVKNFIRKPYLGMRFVFSGDEKARYLGNPLPSGLYIAQVFPHSIFAQAGVQAGDMLYEFNGIKVDAYGDVYSEQLRSKIAFYDLVFQIKMDCEVPLVIYRNGKRHDLRCIMSDTLPFAVYKKYPTYEAVEYDTIAGMVIMELALNHVEEMIADHPELARFQQPEHRINPTLIITNILPGSYASCVGSLQTGNSIVMVNNISVQTLNDWKNALQKSLETGFVVLKTDHDVLTVLSLEKILADEIKLSEAFEYPLSANVKKLQSMMELKKGN